MAKDSIMHLPADLRRAAHRLISLARASNNRGHSDPLSAALAKLAEDDAELVAAEKQWWTDVSDVLMPLLIQVVGKSRARAVAAALDEISGELAKTTGEARGDDLAGELVSRGVVTKAEYAQLDRHNKQVLHHNTLNPLSRIVHASWEQLAADGLAQGDAPGIIKLSIRDD